MFGFLKKKKQVVAKEPEKKPAWFINNKHDDQDEEQGQSLAEFIQLAKDLMPKPKKIEGVAMDSVVSKFHDDHNADHGSLVLDWYAAQHFIGYQSCAVLAQHWLISRACSLPARDAIRQGYDLTVNDGSKLSPEDLRKIRAKDKQFKLNANLEQFVRMGRVFGIRIALFDYDNNDSFWREKPYNPDGVKKGSFRGIIQVDPYWCQPVLDLEAMTNAASQGFYEPTYWRIGALQKIHKSHLCIFRGDEVPDMLKAMYQYGGISIPQKIYERVYAAERTANEAPELAMTKRLTVYKTDLAEAKANWSKFVGAIKKWVLLRNNYGVKTVDKSEDIVQHDTSLADFSPLMMDQYQLVASASGVPVTKLMGTTPKGWQSSGNYEAASYREELESIQVNDLEPFLDRYYEILTKSEEMDLDLNISWKPLDSPTTQVWADINLKKAQTGQVLVASGAIDAEEERDRIMKDPDSDYAGLEKLSDEEWLEREREKELYSTTMPELSQSTEQNYGL